MSSQSPQDSLPILNTQTVAAAAASDPLPPANAPALRSFIANISKKARTGFSARPWSELADCSTFAKPDSITDATYCFRKNIAYFRVNYLSLIAVVLAFSLLTNPISLLLLCLLTAWLFLYLFRPSDPPLVVFGRTYSERETLGILILSPIIVIFLTSVGSVLISAVMIGMAIVCAHGTFRVPDDLFLDEQGPATVGFLNFLSGATPIPTVVPSPVVSGRV